MEDVILTKVTRLEVKVEQQERLHAEMKKDLNDIKQAVNQINLTLAERSGGTKYLITLLTAAALVGGVVSHLLSWLKVI